jgi:FKBP-type peptidyl-prolyl cis-trans isomerase FkpA
MKLIVRLLPAVIAIFLLIQSAAAQTIVNTEHGYRFLNHTNRPGPKALPGQTIVVHVDTWVGDSLMANTRLLGSPREYKLFEKDKLPKDRVPPLYDAVLLMTESDSGTVYQAIDSTIRAILPPELKSQKDVRYNISLLKIITAEQLEAKKSENTKKLETVKAQTNTLAAAYKAGSIKDLKKTASGLQYIIHEQGKGAPIQKNEPVKAHYYGSLTDGTMFDNSFERNEALPFTTGIGQMIPGFDEGAQLLNHGGRATLFIPYQLGYGEEGTPGGPIPAKADLIFYIEMQ